MPPPLSLSAMELGPAREGIQKKPSVSRPSFATLVSARYNPIHTWRGESTNRWQSAARGPGVQTRRQTQQRPHKSNPAGSLPLPRRPGQATWNVRAGERGRGRGRGGCVGSGGWGCARRECVCVCVHVVKQLENGSRPMCPRIAKSQRRRLDTKKTLGDAPCICHSGVSRSAPMLQRVLMLQHVQKTRVQPNARNTYSTHARISQ